MYGHPDMMFRCIFWISTALPLFVFAYTLKPEIDIGAIFDSENYNHFNGVFYRAFQENQLLLQHNISVHARATYFTKNASVLWTLDTLCDFVKGRNLKALLVVGREQTLQGVSQVAQPLGIPILGYTTDTAIDRHVHAHNPLMLMLKPSKIDQARAFLQFFQVNFWYDIILFVQDIFVADGFYEQFSHNTTDHKWNVDSRIIPEKIDLDKLRNLTTSLLVNEPKIVVIHANFSLVKRIFNIVQSDANVTALNHAWFITETSFTRDHHSLFPFPSGTLSIVPNYAVNIGDVILDGTNFIIKSVIGNSDRKSILRNCQSNSFKVFAAVGDTTFRHLRNTKMTGVSGDIEFDDQGKLKASNFLVQNLVREEGQTFWRKVGHINGDDVSPFGIIWPGESITSHVRYGRKKYRIVTNPVKPFVMDEKPHPDYGQCSMETTCIYINKTGKHNVIQAQQDYENGVYNQSNPYTIKCCRGLSVDLLNRLASDLDFDYNLYIVSDMTYGKEINGTWNGMVRDLMDGTAHFAVAAFSITRLRLQVIDFTSAYFFSGFSVLYTETQRESNMQAFLDPFDVPVWFAIIISATLTAIVMGIFEWNSPFGLNPWGKKRKQNYTLASGMTMVYSVLFGHTVKTKSPKAWPSKVMQNMWAFSCIFVIASYTANLAAFIAGKHAGIVYRSIHDPWLLDINVGVLPGSAVEGIVKQLNNRLYQKCQSHKVDTTDNAIKRLIHLELDAYLGDYPILDYARAKLDPDCKLRLLTQTFGEDGYGIALPKGSPLKAPLSKMIQEYHESGYIEDLIDVHFADSRCYKQRIKQEDSRLHVQHHAGSFVMLCCGIIVGVGILFLEHAVFKWLVPRFRDMPGQSLWKSVHVMFFSQRLHRSITSAELVPTNEIYREMVSIMKNKDFIKLFQKNTIKTNKMADAAKRKRLNRNFFDIIEKAKWMKEMQDNNLFGSDSAPSSPTPMIKEISLRDITQAIDLKELRRQNHDGRHNCTEFLLPVKSNGIDDASSSFATASNDAFDWTTPQVESRDISSSETVISDTPLIPKEDAGQVAENTSSDVKFNPFVDISNSEIHPYEQPNFKPPSSDTFTGNANFVADHLYAVPSEAQTSKPAHSSTPNGDLFKPRRKEITFFVESETPKAGAVFEPNAITCGTEVDDRPPRRLSIPDGKQKESRTFHPRKRQTIHGNRREKTHSNFNVDKFSKEELLLMWKSSEVELNQKLKAAQKDKQRLETKLTAMKLHMSTAV